MARNAKPGLKKRKTGPIPRERKRWVDIVVSLLAMEALPQTIKDQMDAAGVPVKYRKKITTAAENEIYTLAGIPPDEPKNKTKSNLKTAVQVLRLKLIRATAIQSNDHKAAYQIENLINKIREDHAQKKKEGGDWPFVNTEQLAAVFGCNVRTIQRMVSERGMPSVDTDRYNLPHAVRWRIEEERKKVESPEERDYHARRAEDMKQATRIKKLRADQMAGKLIVREDVEEQTQERIYAVKSALGFLGTVLGLRLAGVNDPYDVEKITTAEVEKMMGRFATADEQAGAGAVLAERIADGIAGLCKWKPAQTKKIREVLNPDPWNAFTRKEENA